MYVAWCIIFNWIYNNDRRSYIYFIIINNNGKMVLQLTLRILSVVEPKKEARSWRSARTSSFLRAAL
jgi:hypothetical protein